ncbi:hypothetical protein CAOG_07161 [Capsaspora owczarzaki ATCC 30864]|uniref:BZIP domain-containing protein n=1 Tax=Capsaspora owczarzaki (strain ATCC 30864) TaxID=595528 RepID=A0A0D2WWK2_CAPO3|nr:hypothetical protein CAOG_07161 [Capsaspora owczarzaki ATCC 30864]KJE96913.1 hypothetical protein CAOG_007161 [Capsaspora owczarzaki ATCC 30864]|eukprot:XP_004343885.2 hypothetical protein CAOG_07161 [Capsaspora owczarzaki ATCC 30864]
MQTKRIMANAPSVKLVAPSLNNTSMLSMNTPSFASFALNNMADGAQTPELAKWLNDHSLNSEDILNVSVLPENTANNTNTAAMSSLLKSAVVTPHPHQQTAALMMHFTAKTSALSPPKTAAYDHHSSDSEESVATSSNSSTTNQRRRRAQQDDNDELAAQSKRVRVQVSGTAAGNDDDDNDNDNEADSADDTDSASSVFEDAQEGFVSLMAANGIKASATAFNPAMMNHISAAQVSFCPAPITAGTVPFYSPPSSECDLGELPSLNAVLSQANSALASSASTISGVIAGDSHSYIAYSSPQEYDNEPMAPRKRRRPATTEEERQSRRRERNRVAAVVCRQRKQRNEADLKDRVGMLTRDNAQLLSSATQLRQTIIVLKNALLRHHRTCTDPEMELAISSLDVATPASNVPLIAM